MVDKIIALGLIDVRDIEEVGAGPLMEELGLEEPLAQTIVDRCTEEAKLVIVEQEQKKAAEAKAKAADAALLAAGMKGVDAEAFANPLLPPAELAVKTEEEITATDESAGDRMPLAMEATEGIAPELTTHKEQDFGGGGSSGGGELSPAERAIHGVVPGGASGDAAGEIVGEMTDRAEPAEESGEEPPPEESAGEQTFADENDETAALAEGRAFPPRESRDDGR